MSKGHQNRIKRVRLRDGSICIYCKDALGQEVDHVIPTSKGGPDIVENMVVSCRICNRNKWNHISLKWIRKGFIHLARMGMSLDWVDRLFPDLSKNFK